MTEIFGHRLADCEAKLGMALGEGFLKDKRIAELEGLAQRQDTKLRQCATIIYKDYPELYDEIRGELKIYEHYWRGSDE